MRYPRLQRPLAIACLAMAAAAPATAGTWRCGNSYSDRPCPGGQALPLEAAPGTERVREADEQTRRLQAAATRMEAERIRREKASPALAHLGGPSAARAAPAAAAPTAARGPKARPAPKLFTAAGPGRGKAVPKKKPAQAASEG